MRLLALLFAMTSLSAAPDLLRIPVKDIDGKDTTLGAGKPKAVLHTSAGYMVYCATTFK